MRLASRFGYANQIRRDRPLTREELMHYRPQRIRGEDRHIQKRKLYTDPHHHRAGKPAAGRLSAILRLPDPRARPGPPGIPKHMLRLRRDGEINGQHVPEIILLNSHDGTSSYQMLPGYFRFVCQNGCVCGQSLGKCVFHTGET